jgi:hypothetical protein
MNKIISYISKYRFFRAHRVVFFGKKLNFILYLSFRVIHLEKKINGKDEWKKVFQIGKS